MLVISDNLNMAHRHVAAAVEKRDGGSLRELAHKITEAGADVIDINIAPLNAGSAEALVWIVEQVQRVSDLQLSLDSRSVDAVMAGAKTAVRRPLLNAYSLQSAHPADVVDRLIPFAAAEGLELVLPATGASGPPLDADPRVALAEGLVNAALAAGVAPDLIYVDPVVVHVGGGDGQRHAVSVVEALRSIKALFEPPVKTLAGVEYVSSGAPRQLRSALNRTYLAMLGGLGLDAVIVDVLDAAVMRDIRLIKGLRNESLYSVSDAEL